MPRVRSKWASDRHHRPDRAAPAMPTGRVAQFAVEEINKSGGVQGQPIELYLEDTARTRRSRSAMSAG